MTSSCGHQSDCSNRPSTLKVRLGRPKKSAVAQNLPLTEEEKKDKRRVANRDSARRMRARRLESMESLAGQVQVLEDKCQQLQTQNNTLVNGCKQLREENAKLCSMIVKLQGTPPSSLNGKYQSPTSLPEATSSMAACTSGDSSDTEGRMHSLRQAGVPSSPSLLPEAPAVLPRTSQIHPPPKHNHTMSGAGPVTIQTSMPEMMGGSNLVSPAASPVVHTSQAVCNSPSVHTSGYDSVSGSWCHAAGVMGTAVGSLPNSHKHATLSTLSTLPLLDSSTSSLMDEYTSMSSCNTSSSAAHPTPQHNMHTTSQPMLPTLSSTNMLSSFPQNMALAGLFEQPPNAQLSVGSWNSQQHPASFSNNGFQSLDNLNPASKLPSLPARGRIHPPTSLNPSLQAPTSMDVRGLMGDAWNTQASTLPPVAPLDPLRMPMSAPDMVRNQSMLPPSLNTVSLPMSSLPGAESLPDEAMPLFNRNSCGVPFSSGCLDDALASLFPGGLAAMDMGPDCTGRANSLTLSWLKAA